MVWIRSGPRVAAIVGAVAVAAFWVLSAPASALSVAVPDVPTPLPVPTLPLPTGASVSGGTGGEPLGIGVDGPVGTDAQLPGLPIGPAAPIGPSEPVTDPIAAPDPAPAAPASGAATGADNPHGDGSIRAPGNEAVTPASPVGVVGAGADATSPDARLAPVNAVIDAQPADSLLRRVTAIAGRVALWAALAAVLFTLHLLVAAAVRVRREEPTPVS